MAAALMPAPCARSGAGFFTQMVGYGVAISHAALLNPKFFGGNRPSAKRYGDQPPVNKLRTSIDPVLA
ncbi:MAG: hypothetical protein WAV02_14695 [Stellaceae bacterium]